MANDVVFAKTAVQLRFKDLNALAVRFALVAGAGSTPHSFR
jgi:hypothetical protein